MRIREPLTITCRNISKRRETLVNQGFPAHKKITVPTAPMSVQTVIVSARSGVRTPYLHSETPRNGGFAQRLGECNTGCNT